MLGTYFALTPEKTVWLIIYVYLYREYRFEYMVPGGGEYGFGINKKNEKFCRGTVT
jgi:hypothetical protein